MKLCKRGIVAIVIVLCMVLSSVSAFAATVTMLSTFGDFPAEGISVKMENVGLVDPRIRWVMSKASMETLQVKANSPSNYLVGLTFSATVTYVNANKTNEDGSLTYKNKFGDGFLGSFTREPLKIDSQS